MAEGQYPKDLEDKINNITIYQIGVSDVSLVLNKKIESVDTGGSDEFIYGATDHELKVKAYRLGADAIVNHKYVRGSFSSTSYATGTPVKYVD